MHQFEIYQSSNPCECDIYGLMTDDRLLNTLMKCQVLQNRWKRQLESALQYT